LALGLSSYIHLSNYVGTRDVILSMCVIDHMIDKLSHMMHMIMSYYTIYIKFT